MACENVFTCMTHRKMEPASNFLVVWSSQNGLCKKAPTTVELTKHFAIDQYIQGISYSLIKFNQ